MTKLQLQQALKFQEAKAIKLAAENDKLRHALAISEAGNRFCRADGDSFTKSSLLKSAASCDRTCITTTRCSGACSS